MRATCCVRRADLIPVANGRFAVRAPNGSEVLSIQPDGSIGKRAMGTAGPWEVCRISDDTLVFEDTAYPTGAYALLLVD